ncbi:MAG: extracellular solute-binding protein [Spirochaetes bacterium]|nr:extracellular solute-binding protein [Spirochaetota bacterium]
MNKKTAILKWLGLISIALAFLLAATGVFAGGQKEKGAAGKTTLNVWYHQYGEKGTHEAVGRYAKEYEKAHPGISVKVSWVVGDYNTKLQTALAAKSEKIDVFEKSSVSLTMVEAGQVVPLDDLFTPEVRADFSKKAILNDTVKGKIYGVRMLIDSGAFYYRPSLMKNAGLTEPKNFEELYTAAKKLTTKDIKGLFLGNSGGASMAFLLPYSNGNDKWISDNGKSIVFNTPQTVEALAGLRKLAKSGSLLIGAPQDWWDPSAFITGLTAMTWGGLWEFPAIKKEFGDDFNIFPVPPFKAGGHPATFFGGWSEMISGFSKNIPQAKEYIKWMWLDSTGTEIQIDWNTGYGFHITPRKSATKAAEKLSGDPRAARFVDFTGKWGLAPSPAGNTLWDSVMNSAYYDMVNKVLKTDKPVSGLVKDGAAVVQKRLKDLY